MKGLPELRIVASLFLAFVLLFPLPPGPLQAGSKPKDRNSVRTRVANQVSTIYSLLKSSEAASSDAALRKLAHTIVVESNKYSVDPLLVLAIMKVESRFQAKAVSSQGARGLMQILPSIAHAMSEELEIKRWKGIKSLDDPIINTKLGVFYLAQMKDQFTDLRHALAAYHSGPYSVKARLEKKQPVRLDYPRKVILVYRAYKGQSYEAG